MNAANNYKTSSSGYEDIEDENIVEVEEGHDIPSSRQIS